MFCFPYGFSSQATEMTSRVPKTAQAVNGVDLSDSTDANGRNTPMNFTKHLCGLGKIVMRAKHFQTPARKVGTF
ncbi:hypothetical protein E2C01_052225 [Portunus trituberculatus]|uniref:Uncharacterized protein n=1 Tax=Portunus trituberculatus TaxID=210409 RepID=A0A5B7GL02_PORTR|nr:hypothetical protein [Portunus trituberculatus]